MKKVELLSPAGNFECLKAAINNGADAVYLGGSNFSARAFADNFDNNQIVEAINYAHLRKVKVYVTLNTLLNEFEIDNAYNQAKFLYEHNVDALLVQDLGLFYRLRKDFPDFELHASTQMHIHNEQGVINAAKLGFKRVVLARESSLDLIKKCCKQDVEIECFVHGAICVSYSGQCLLSSATKQRSANKGMCAQCCRLKYNLYENNKKVNTDTEYLLSPKDMCLINDLPKMIEAGVSSFKIEGRMKSPAYVGYVTRLYRKAIDSYYKGIKFEITDEELNNIKLLYNRGFTNTYLLNNDSNLFNNIRPNHMGLEIGKVIDVRNNSCFIKLDRDVNQFDGIRIINITNDTGLILNMIKVNDLLVNKAIKNQIIEINLEDKVDIGDIVVKTLDYKLEEEIVNTLDKKIDINLDVIAIPNDHFKIKCLINDKEFNYISDIKVDKAIKQPINDDNIITSFNSVSDHPYSVKDIKVELDNSFLPLKVINDIRRDFYEKLDLFILNSFKRNELFDLELKDITNDDNSLNDNKLNPVINLDSNYYDDYNEVSELGGLLLDTIKDGNYTLNISNSYAYEFLLRLGFNNVVLSTELTTKMINELISRFKDRTSIDKKPYVLVKGKRALMNISRDPFSQYLTSNQNVKLSDGNNVLDVKFKDDFVELLENDYFELDTSDLIDAYKLVRD